MKLSKKEQELIVKMRKEKEDELPKMEGYAKEDMYQVIEYSSPAWSASASEKEKWIKDFAENYFKLSVPAGTKFDCYYDDGRESWYDTKSGLFSGMDEDWAREHLRDIKPVKKKKK